MPRAKVVNMKDVQVVRKNRGKKYTVPVKLPPALKKPNVLSTANVGMKARPKREPDLIVAILQNMIAGSRLKPIDLACKATICYTTIKNIIEGKTTRPWHSTAKSIIEACDYDYLIVPRSVEAPEVA